MKTLPLFILAFCFILGACTEPQVKDSSSDTDDKEGTETSIQAEYKISPFSESFAYPDAVMMSYTYTDNKFAYKVAGKQYELGNQTPDAAQKLCANSAKGQHIHLIVDDKPYAAKYTADFEHEVADGEHYILSFLSRSYHESIKTDAAHKADKVTVANGSITSTEKIGEPMLFYSRPKGSYIGKANTEKVMLDFFVVNTELAKDGNKVKVEINNKETYTIDVWQPYYLEGLPMGENTVKLTLVDHKGNAVDAPLNPVSRTFTLMEEPDVIQ